MGAWNGAAVGAAGRSKAICKTGNRAVVSLEHAELEIVITPTSVSAIMMDRRDAAESEIAASKCQMHFHNFEDVFRKCRDQCTFLIPRRKGS